MTNVYSNDFTYFQKTRKSEEKEEFIDENVVET